MTPEDHFAVDELKTWAEDTYELEGYGDLLRVGSSRRTGATGEHLHYHIIMPEIDPATGRAKPYCFPVG
jgi:hypothetical protein